MSGMLKPRNLMLGGAVLGGIYFVGLPFNIFNTPASQNVGDRFAAVGGSNTHAPGVATPRGNSDNVMANQKSPSGIDTPNFQEKLSDQRPGEPGPFDKQWNKAHYGSERGK